MYLSKLTLNPYCRLAMRDLADPYQMHRTIMRAFPSRQDGGPGRVLFRVEPTSHDDPKVVLVQSDKKPDWSVLEALPGYLIDVRSKWFEIRCRPGQRFCFRLRANPTVKTNGKRYGLVRYDRQCKWLDRKAQQGGFRLVDFAPRRSVKLIGRAKGDPPQTHLAVDFEGILEVADPELFADTIKRGIGSAKGLGFGLLSVAKPP